MHTSSCLPNLCSSSVVIKVPLSCGMLLLCAELYGPQAPEALGSAADAVATGVELIVDDLQDTMQEEHVADMTRIAREISAEHEELAARLALLLDQQDPETCCEE